MSIRDIVRLGFVGGSLPRMGYSAGAAVSNNNDLQTLDSLGEVSPDMGSQYIGAAYVKDGRKTVALLTTNQTITQIDGPNADQDPNNMADKYNDRFDDRTYYRRNRS